MSELIYKNDRDNAIRWNLLAGASAIALAAHIASSDRAYAQDADHPVVWIELGGQLSRLQDSQEIFAPAIMESRPLIFDPSQRFEKPPGASLDEVGNISVQPSGLDWIFSASVRYGRATNKKHVTQQTNNPYPFQFKYSSPIIYPHHLAVKFAETSVKNEEQHLVLDFQAGKDVGLGLFGSGTSSTISVGVRYAQFRSTSNITLRSDPDWAIKAKYYTYYSNVYKFPIQNYHSNVASFTARRSFHGIGPALSWKASTPLVGNSERGELAFDWGINASILFGRQKTRTHHQTTGRYHYWKYTNSPDPRPITYQGPVTPDHARSRSVTVPNIGGFAGISLMYPNAKVSVGYRADFFFGAMDGGIDSHRSDDIGFNGPYASISIGFRNGP